MKHCVLCPISFIVSKSFEKVLFRRIEVVFVVGQPSNPATQQELELESKRYGDILQYVGPDRGK